MKKSVLTTLLAFAATMAVAGPIVFPAKGQTEEQQKADETYCKGWAIEEIGGDPSAVKPAADAEKRNKSTVRGAARGAALGAVVSSAAGGGGDDIRKAAGGAAVVGAVAGRGGAKQAEQKEAAANQNEYERAFGACMEAKNYTVK
jgi:hypothetical protein